MNIVRRAAQQIERRMSLSDLDNMMDQAYGGAPTYTGKLVSQDTALRVSAVWACVNGRAADWAKAPLRTFSRLDAAKGEPFNAVEPATSHYLWSLLQHEANPLMTAWRFKYLMQSWVDLAGNAYAEIEMNGRGQVTALWPWRPDRVKIYRMALTPDAPLIYEYTMQDQTKIRLPHEHILHLRGMTGPDGVMGFSPIEYHKQTVGLAMAITEHGGRYFANGARPLGIIEFPGKMSEKSLKSLRESWAAEHQGLSHAHRVAVLEEGTKYQEVGASMVDAQYLDTMRFTVEDFARIFDFPVHRLKMLDRMTNNNIEFIGREYVDYSLGHIAANWQQELEYSLLSVRDRDSYCIRADFSDLLLGDMKTQAEFYGSTINNGIMTQNEARAKLHMNPLPNRLANVPWKQGAQVPAGDDYQQPNAEKLARMVELAQLEAAGKPNGLAH